MGLAYIGHSAYVARVLEIHTVEKVLLTVSGKGACIPIQYHNSNI